MAGNNAGASSTPVLSLFSDIFLALLSLFAALDALTIMHGLASGEDEDVLIDIIGHFVSDSIFIPMLAIGAVVSSRVTRALQSPTAKDPDSAAGVGWMVFVAFYLTGAATSGTLYPGSVPWLTVFTLLAVLCLVIEPAVEYVAGGDKTR
ncbi:hypothetical protein [Nesterenkonia flava]|uniref:Uncharacterized protein n=1 Tax=Nesterenkonia flava TaxID=469799 RepID=A0ABU1FQ96_9MICC|nr:hypothetical protein [Nesterenkonia flava]MDR5710779.1 hypothetical protein [Nesterenkonia flava]